MRITVLFLMLFLFSFYHEVVFAADENQTQQNAQQVTDKALTSQQNKKNSQTQNNKGNSSLPKAHSVGHTERPKSESKQQVNSSNGENEQAQLDKGLIDAQIDDVLSSAEFLALESALFSTLGDKNGSNKSTKKGKKNKRNSDDPEFFLLL